MGFPLARGTATVASMAQKRPRLKAVAAAAGRDPKRSPLFHWLVKNHDALAPGLRSKRVDWAPVIASAAAEGVKTDWGTEPQAQTVRRTWRKACAYVEAERKAIAARETGASPKAERKLYPRDMPKDWRPPEAAASHKPQGVPSQELAVVGSTHAPDSGGFRPTLDPDGTFGGRPVTRGPLLPEPDYTGMTRSERIIARNEWRIKRRSIG